MGPSASCIPAAAGLVLTGLGYFLISGWDIGIAEPGLTVHLAITGLGFGLLITPIAIAGTETVKEDIRGAAASTITAMRIVGMTLGLAALTAWGTTRFGILVDDIRLPFPLPGETEAQAAQRAEEFNTLVQDAGMTLFQDFFTIAMAVSVLALIPVALMVVKRRN